MLDNRVMATRKRLINAFAPETETDKNLIVTGIDRHGLKKVLGLQYAQKIKKKHNSLYTWMKTVQAKDIIIFFFIKDQILVFINKNVFIKFSAFLF